MSNVKYFYIDRSSIITAIYVVNAIIVYNGIIIVLSIYIRNNSGPKSKGCLVDIESYINILGDVLIL